MDDSLVSDLPARLDYLTKQLYIPGATLKRAWLDEELLALWLMNTNSEQELDTRAIGLLWQKMPYWAFAWAGGRALSQFIVHNPEYVAGKRVLDFGCGSGIAGIAAALAGASEVGVIDVDHNALLMAQINAGLNGVCLQTADKGDASDYDLLLAADVLYDISSHKDLEEYITLIPEGLFAEKNALPISQRQYQCIDQLTSSTVPTVGDFDEYVEVNIYTQTYKPCWVN